MRQITATEKYRAVNEGKMAKKEFVRQMRQQYPMYISQYDGYDSTVQILKNRNMIYEAAKPAFSGVKVYDDRPALTYSLDSLDRGIRAELAALGVTMPHQGVKPEDYLKAEKKAKDNLEKNPTHYLDLMSGESNKVDKHDREKEVKRGAEDIDSFNSMKKATLKESIREDEEEDAKNDQDSYDHDYPHQDEGMSEDAKKNMLGQVVGALRTKYPDITGSILKDFIKTHYQDLLDGADIESEFKEYIDNNYEGPSDMKEAEEGIDMSSKDGYISFIDNEDILANYTPEDAEEMARELAMNHHDAGQDQDNFVKSFMAAYKEGGYDYDDQVHEKQGKDHDGDGDIDSDDYMAAKDKAIKKAMGKDVNESSDYVALAKQTFDGNPRVVLTHGDPNSIRSDKPIRGLSLKLALNYIRNNADASAIENGDVFAEAGPDGVLRITIGDQEFDIKKAMGKDVDEDQEGDHNFYDNKEKSKQIIQIAKDAIALMDEQPGTSVKDAIEAVMEFMDESYAMKRMQRAHTQDRLAGKKSTYDQAKEKDKGKEKQLKEAIKSIIKKTLINEAATVKLSDWAESYESFPGVKPVVNELENIVTEIETFYDKMSDKISKVFEKSSDFENEEGLKIGGFIAPSLEAAFKQDLGKVIKKGSFLSKINLPKVRTITQADIDSQNSSERPLGEEDVLEEPKSTVFTPNF